MTRSNKTYHAYEKSRKRPVTTPCVFCRLARKPHAQAIIETKHGCFIIKNRYPYHIWDSSRVVDHLLLVPYRHITTIADLTSEESAAYMSALKEYEAKGYSVYVRGAESHMKSIAHQHTHLIRLADQKVRFFLYLRKPYIHLSV